MYTNSVRIRLNLSFKAETHELGTIVDLDHGQTAGEESPDFHLLLARAAGIDPYSYLYEALESHDLDFSEATGMAASCCRDGKFDWPQFVQLRREEQDMRVVRAIAAQILDVPDLDQRTDLKAALLAAYRAGKGEIAADFRDVD